MSRTDDAVMPSYFLFRMISREVEFNRLLTAELVDLPVAVIQSTCNDSLDKNLNRLCEAATNYTDLTYLEKVNSL